jgi:hypothetical protein
MNWWAQVGRLFGFMLALLRTLGLIRLDYCLTEVCVRLDSGQWLVIIEQTFNK